ncbi:Hypothetical predicted protein [Paramuricea clavata]|uniref:Uncharacterized protein n=1 Tax=Paramuricea clavata TaxID=317549 RepID=A0A7D9H928_PARCT|nr:Hypothetical predicted protein [Paramuricea clavata]
MSRSESISGKGRLTTGKMDVLQNYYGLAIRGNLDNVEEMAKAVKASLFHVASTEENPQHHLCPKGEDSWCGYQRDSKTYKHKNGIPKPIVELVEPIFDDLADPALLKKCTHGLTQNPNECLNGIIWDRCPKTTYVEQETVALATYLAVLKFNDGDISYLKILEDLDITPGFFTCKDPKYGKNSVGEWPAFSEKNIFWSDGAKHIQCSTSSNILLSGNKKASLLRGDQRIAAITTDDLIAKEAKYHKTCYRNYTRVNYKVVKDYQSNEDEPFDAVKEILFDLYDSPDVIEYAILTKALQDNLRGLEGVDEKYIILLRET